jgi:hypothetical protein
MSKVSEFLGKLKSGAEDVMGVTDWKTVIEEHKPVSPVDIRKNPQKYKDWIKKAKQKRIHDKLNAKLEKVQSKSGGKSF